MTGIDRLRRPGKVPPLMPRQNTLGRNGRLYSRALVLALGASIGVVSVSGIGYAYMQTTGSGSTSSFGGSISVTIPTAASVNGLYPGATRPVTVTVSNPASSNAAVKLNSVTPGTTTISAAGPVSTGSVCDPTAVSLDTASLALQSAPIAPGSTGTFSANIKMSTSAGNRCQGATFSIPLTVTARVG